MDDKKFNEKLKSVGARARKRTYDGTIGRAKGAVNLQKQKIQHSNPYKFAKQKGFAAKAKFVGTGIKNKAKEYAFIKKLQKLYKKIVKIVKFVIRNIKWIGALVGIIVFGTNALLYGMSVAAAIGDTPHYYCDLDPSPNVRKSAPYIQYCNLNNASDFMLDSINGHYISQDGSGPCLACSYANMLLRYYTAHNINFYDYLFGDDGQYPVDMPIVSSRGGNTLRKFINANTTSTNTKEDGSERYTNKGSDYGAKGFAYKHGISNFTMADWCYMRDPSLDFSGQEIGQAYMNYSTNEKWVFDLSIPSSFTEGSAWNARSVITGAAITVQEVKATIHVVWKATSGSEWAWNNADDLKKLLDEHPSGIVVYRDYINSSGNSSCHAILVTGYKDDVFYVVDSGKGLLGGFEGPCTNSNFCYQQCWNQTVLSNPNTNTPIAYAYIEEDKPA